MKCYKTPGNKFDKNPYPHFQNPGAASGWTVENYCMSMQLVNSMPTLQYAPFKKKSVTCKCHLWYVSASNEDKLL